MILESRLLERRVHVRRQADTWPNGTPRPALDYRGTIVAICNNGVLLVEEDGTGVMHWPNIDPIYDGTVVVLLPRESAATGA